MAKAFPNTGVTIIDSSSDLTGFSPSEGLMVFQKDSNELKIYDGSSWVSVVDTDNKPMDAFTSYTPTLSQGGGTNNIAKTINYANYLLLGKLIIVSVRLSVTGTGTAGANMAVSAPSGLFPKQAGAIMGSAIIYDASTGTSYGGQAYNVNGDFMFLGDWSATNAWGLSPSIALANGDVVAFTAIYEVN